MDSIGYIFRAIFHFFTSNSRHGTHSPFVYKLADEVIYNRRSKVYPLDNRINRLANLIADYYDVEYTPSLFDTGQERALFVEDATKTVEELAFVQQEFRYLLIKGIYKTKIDRIRWSNICLDKRFIVCVDLFFFGLVFYRNEQPKQLFKLRFPICT